MIRELPPLMVASIEPKRLVRTEDVQCGSLEESRMTSRHDTAFRATAQRTGLPRPFESLYVTAQTRVLSQTAHNILCRSSTAGEGQKVRTQLRS